MFRFKKNFGKNIFKKTNNFNAQYTSNTLFKSNKSNLHLFRILLNADNLSDNSPIERLKKSLEQEIKAYEKTYYEKSPKFVHAHRTFKPEKAFTIGITPDNKNYLFNKEHFFKNLPGIMMGTTLNENTARDFLYNNFNNKSSEKYVYSMNYPFIFVYGPHVFYSHYRENEFIFDENEAASCVNHYDASDFLKAKKYKFENNEITEQETFFNENYQNRDIAIHTVSSQIEEYNQANEVFCNIRNIINPLTGISFERANELKSFLETINFNQFNKLTDKTLIIDVLNNNMTTTEQNNLIELVIQLKHQILEEEKNNHPGLSKKPF